MSQQIANPEAIRAKLGGLLAHHSFRESERHRRLLKFLVESTLSGRSDELKEFVIAAEVWGRDVSFDPRINSTVRVEVGRLRARLERYYSGDGSSDPIRFRIPVGGYTVVFENSHKRASEPSTSFEHFEILEMLGRGGMGEIRKARDTRLNRFVALKFIPETLPQDHATVERFAAEARAAASINHPNICTVYETGFLQGRPFFAMELLEGQTLRHRLQDGAVPLDLFLNWAIQITDGMDAAHSSGIIHRDLKPANLFITERDQAKILDFGLAKLRGMIPQHALDDREGVESGVLTIAGTIGYMSPEQTRGEPLDSRADLFALGTVFYEMLTGKAPFSHPSAADIHRAVLTEDPPPPSKLNQSVPHELDRIVLKALEKDRDLRYQNAADLRADLKRLKRDSDSLGALPVVVPSAPASATKVKSRSTGQIAIGAAAVLLIVLAGVFFWLRARRPAFAGSGNIVLADFANSTGDTVFDATLREGLATQLQQSPNLGVLSNARIAQTMKLMMQPKDTRLTPLLAREVCQRTGSAASIEGSIASLGSEYVLGLTATDCKTGDTLAQAQETADGKEKVLNALALAAGKLLNRLGTSLPSQQESDAPASVSTNSLEALEAYGLGVKAQSVGDNAAAIIHYKRAVALDPNFAMAYGRLGICVGIGPEGDGYYRKAYELRDKVSEREQFYLAAHYEQYVTGNLDAAEKLMETWEVTYPHDINAAPNLLKLYLTTGEYDKAYTQAQKIVQESPSTPAVNAMRMGTTLFYLNRLDEAKAILDDTVIHHSDTPVIHFYLYEIDFLKRDEPGMAKEIAYLRAQPGWANNILDLESFSAAFMGQFVKARGLSEMAVGQLRHDGDKDGAGSFVAEMSLEEALVGNRALAEQKGKLALSLSTTRDTEPNVGIALALAGDSAGATRIATDLDKRFPTDTMIQNSVAIIRAAILMSDGKSPEDVRKAIELLAGIAHYDLSGTLYLVPVYVRGRAYLAAGDPARAAAEFQRIIDHPGVPRNFITGALAYAGLGDAEMRGGEKPKARADYESFLALWKNADPELPVLKQAKASFDGLNH